MNMKFSNKASIFLNKLMKSNLSMDKRFFECENEIEFKCNQSFSAHKNKI
jgi:hypothetical protein